MGATTPKMQRVLIPTKNQLWITRVWRWLVWPKKWMITEDWYYRLPDGTVVCVPKGFILDAVSNLRIFWAILSPTGLLLIPGVVHDFAFRYDYLWIVDHGQLKKYKPGAGQKAWDNLFLETSVRLNGRIGIEYIAWATLRALGWAAWRKNRKLNAPEIMPDTSDARQYYAA